MALQNCSECGGTVSDQADACPHCGAPQRRPASPNKTKADRPAWAGAAIGLVLVMAAFVFLTTRGTGSSAPAESAPGLATAKSDAAETKPRPVDFDQPVETRRAALVCPLAALFDQREGRGVQAAMKSRLSFFGRKEEAEKAGCEEWREGFVVVLSPNERERARQWQARDSCGMLEAEGRLFFSCDLRNVAPTVQQATEVPPQTVQPNQRAEATNELPEPLKMQPGAPATLTGTFHIDYFENCCVDGKSTRQRYAYVRLDRDIYLHELGPDARAKNENLVGGVQLGGVDERGMTSIAPGQRISVSCSSLEEASSGHFALDVYCRDATVVQTP